jgi:tight adherence protein C
MEGHLMALVISLTSFLAVAGLTMGLGLLLKSAYTQAQTIRSSSPWVSESPLGVPLKMLARLNLHPRCAGLRAQIEQKLLFAGQPWALNAAEYLSLVELSVLASWMLAAVLSIFGGAGIMAAFLIGLLSGVAVAWLVYTWLDHLVAERRIQLARQFPYFLDLAVMNMEAGSTFEETVEIYVRYNEKEALSEELRLMLTEIQLGKRRDETLLGMMERIAAAEVRHAIHATVQGIRAGTPLGHVLRDQADTMRFKRSQLAERAAEELKIRIMGPGVLMMIAILLLVLGPVFINVTTSGIL